MISGVSTHSPLWLVVLPVEILMYGGYGILVNLSKVDGQLPYLSSSFVMVTEYIKLLISITILLLDAHNQTLPASISLYNVLPYAVPAVCYGVNNNLAVALQHYMDPATYMVLGNLKIVTTAFLFKVIMKKELTARKWLAICLLTVGSGVNSYTALTAKSSSLSEIHVSVQGLIMLACYCFISGFSGVYSEFVYKKDSAVSVHYQNALLYAFGTALNAGFWVFEVSKEHENQNSHASLYILNGYSGYTWMLVMSQALCGLVMSVIMKYLNNMVRVFVVATAPLVTTVLAYFVFSLHIPLVFLCSVMCVTAALFLYNT